MQILLRSLLFLSISLGNAQNCNSTFRGIVKNAHNGALLPSTEVYIHELNTFRITDKNGGFKFKGLCNKTYEVSIYHTSFEPVTIKHNVTNSKIHEFLLKESTHHLTDVILFSNAKKNGLQEHHISKELLEDKSASSLGDVLTEISGVHSLNTGDAIVKPMINGLHSSRVVVIANDVWLQDQDWGVEHAPSIDINSASKIRVIKGSGALKYSGSAIGGIVILEPERMMEKDSLFGKVILTGISNGSGGSGNFRITKTYDNGFYLSGQGSYKQLGDTHSPNYNLTNTGLRSNAFVLQGGVNRYHKAFQLYYSSLKNEIGILKSSHIGTISDLVSAINNKEPSFIHDFSYTIAPPKQEIHHQLFKWDGYYRIPHLGKWSMQYDYQHNKRLEYDDSSEKPSIDLELQTHTVKTDVNFNSSKLDALESGVLFRFQKNVADPFTGVRRLIPDYKKYELAGYVSARKYFEKLTLEGAIRYDFSRLDAFKYYRKSSWEERGYQDFFSAIIVSKLENQILTNPKFDYHNVSFSTGAHVDIKSSHLSLNFALSNRAPNPSELFSDGLHHSASRIERGDLKIKQENSYRVGLEYQYSKKGVHANLNLFVNKVDDYIYIYPTGIEQTNRGSFQVWNYTQSNVYLMGIDTDVIAHFNDHWHISNQTSYTKGYHSNSTPLAYLPPLHSKTTLAYSNATFYNYNFEVVSEWTAAKTAYPNYNFDAYIPEKETYENVDISTPPKGYHLFHLSNSITLNGKVPLNIGFTVKNVLNTSYRNYMNRLRYFADETGRNITIQIKIKF